MFSVYVEIHKAGSGMILLQIELPFCTVKNAGMVIEKGLEQASYSVIQSDRP